MAVDFVAALREEITNLESELAKNLTFRRLQEAKRMLGLYEAISTGPTPPADEPPPPPWATKSTAPRRNLVFRRVSPDRQKALNAAQEFIAAGIGAPIPTTVIYEHLTSLGLEIGGSDPRNNLSAMLSNSKLFQSHGRAGWTLLGDPSSTAQSAAIDALPESTEGAVQRSDSPGSVFD